MKITDRLHQAAAPIWQQYHKHPFVTGIGDGTLDLEKFQYYLLQDYLYLFNYAKVFAYGVIKAQDQNLMRRFAANVDALLGGEMQIHRAYMARLGIPESEVLQGKPALANLSYTHYMLAVAAAGSTAEIVAAVLSCSWSYAEIATQLAQNPDAANHPFFGQWVSGYLSAEYQQTNAALIVLMDELSRDCTDAQAARLEDIFVRCCRYELDFWNMAWTMPAE